MYRFGAILLFMGAFSFLFNFVDQEFVLLLWIDLWGRQTGNHIRIGMIIAGLIIALVGIYMDKYGSYD